MTDRLYQRDGYLRTFAARVTGARDGGVVLDRTAFFPAGGGVAGDEGMLSAGGRTWRVTAQADADHRTGIEDIARLRTRSDAGAMVPLGSLATFQETSGPYRMPRYNLFPAVELQGAALSHRVEVPQRGHAPNLLEPVAFSALQDFLRAQTQAQALPAAA